MSRRALKAVFDVAKASIGYGTQSRSSSAPPSLSATRVHKRCTATVVWRPTRVIRGRYRAFYGNRNRSTRFLLLQRAIDELGQWFRKWRIEVNPDKSAAIQFRTVMTYASPVFAHAAPKHYIDYRTHRSDSSTSRDHNALRAAVDYQQPHPTHLIRRPRNVLTDPPDALTAAVESLNDVNDTHD
ncbi:hypothetical protein EVAR_93604_1 [Eumeta japonica]|uniref:Uncharacterized protein n=1 Tax=Eumeta variegata TaxID=151549 RepID=A0A4C1TQK3_EUMVA|nr:hypothetical protein EVAR_93604_1 [Eumeta japonica]